jgi:phage terminase large subunit GpA-like protein
MHSQKTENIHLDQLSTEERQAISLSEKVGILEWIPSKRVLSSRSEEKGPVRLERTPYIVPWLEATVDPYVEEVVICASAQIAKTEFGMHVLGFYADVERAPVLYTLADEMTSKHISRDRIKKMFEDSPKLYHLIDRAPVVNNEELELNNGAYISVMWASSVAAIATKAFRVTISDEIDKPGYYVKTSEAMPLSLIRERTESYHNFKHIFFSTPTIEQGNITVELNSCDLIYDWHVPCPHCGTYQPLRFSPEYAYGFKDGKYLAYDGSKKKIGKVIWHGGREATRHDMEQARYQCGTCKKEWTTAMKNKAVMQGLSVPRKRINFRPRKVGFHINRLYSLLGKSGDLGKIVSSFVSAVKSKNPRIIQGVINSTFAEPFRPLKKLRRTEKLEKLKDDRPRGLVPGQGQVACLLAGVDTQDDGFYYEIRAFGYGLEGESWCIREGFVSSFAGLVRVLWEDKYRDIDGTEYTVRLALQDAMGHRTSEVYQFCRLHHGFIMPTQGMRTMATPYNFRTINRYPGTQRKIIGGLQLVRFDTNYYKSKLSAKLDIMPVDPGAYHYHSETDKDWLKQMTVEVIGQDGFWHNPLERPNHAWDCSVLTMLAHEILEIAFWNKPEVPIERVIEEQERLENSWLNRGDTPWLKR